MKKNKRQDEKQKKKMKKVMCNVNLIVNEWIFTGTLLIKVTAS